MIKKSEQFTLAASQLPFVLEKIFQFETLDIPNNEGLRKTIVQEAHPSMVNAQVVHLVLELPERIKGLCRQCIAIGDHLHNPFCGRNC